MVQVQHRAFEGTPFALRENESWRVGRHGAKGGATFTQRTADYANVGRKGRVCRGRREDFDGCMRGGSSFVAGHTAAR